MASSSAAEEKFARRLASNDLPVRNRALKKLSRWIEERSALEDGFTEMELLKLWKGLFVCMWHSDKPLVQEELAENIAKLIYVFKIPERGLQFVSAFFATMAREWVGIDRLRLDKFYTLIRKVLSHCFKFLQQNHWKNELVEAFSALLSEGPLHEDTVKACLGVQLHVLEVYLPELLSTVATAVGTEEDEGVCPSVDLLTPLIALLANTTDCSVVRCLETNVVQKLQKDSTVQRLHVCSDVMSRRLKELAISRETVGRNRKKLYTLSRRFSNMNEVTESADTAEDPPPKKKAKKAKKLKQKCKA